MGPGLSFLAQTLVAVCLVFVFVAVVLLTPKFWGLHRPRRQAPGMVGSRPGGSQGAKEGS